MQKKITGKITLNADIGISKQEKVNNIKVDYFGGIPMGDEINAILGSAGSNKVKVEVIKKIHDQNQSIMTVTSETLNNINNYVDQIKDFAITLEKQIGELSFRMQEKSKKQASSVSFGADSASMKELLNVIDDFNDRLGEIAKKKKLEQETLEKIKRDLNEMKAKTPSFKNEKDGLVSNINEEFVKGLTYEQGFRHQYQYDILEILFERILLHKVEYYVNLALQHEFKLNGSAIEGTPQREDEVGNRNLSEHFVEKLNGLREANPIFLSKFIGNSHKYEDFLAMLMKLIRTKKTEDKSIKIKDGSKIVMNELLLVRQIEDLGDNLISLLSDQNYVNVSWEEYTHELSRIIHGQLKRSGYVYETSEKEHKSNKKALEFINKLVEISPYLLKKHIKNELIHYYFRLDCFDCYKFKNLLLAADSFNMEAKEEAVNFFEIMNRLNTIKLTGAYWKADQEYSKFFFYVIKVVILIGFDAMTRKRIENKINDIKIKEKVITNYENETREINSKIELIKEIKENVEMGQTRGERKQMANKENEAKESESDSNLLSLIDFNLKQLKRVTESIPKTQEGTMRSIKANLIHPNDINNI